MIEFIISTIRRLNYEIRDNVDVEFEILAEEFKR